MWGYTDILSVLLVCLYLLAPEVYAGILISECGGNHTSYRAPGERVKYFSARNTKPPIHNFAQNRVKKQILCFCSWLHI